MEIVKEIISKYINEKNYIEKEYKTTTSLEKMLENSIRSCLSDIKFFIEDKWEKGKAISVVLNESTLPGMVKNEIKKAIYEMSTL